MVTDMERIGDPPNKLFLLSDGDRAESGMWNYQLTIKTSNVVDNSVYGKADTVQPAAGVVIYLIKY
jgi:hypothetical protein